MQVKVKLDDKIFISTVQLILEIKSICANLLLLSLLTPQLNNFATLII